MTDDVDNSGNGWAPNNEAPVLGDIQRNVVEDNCVDQAKVTMALVTSCQQLLDWQKKAYDVNVQLQEENDAAIDDLAKEHATEVDYLRGQRDGLREQADRHQQQIYQYFSHINILENKYGSETAAVLNTLFGRIKGLETTVTAEVERRMDLDKQLTLAETVRDEAKEALADAERRNGMLTRHIWWIEGKHRDALARGTRAEEERDQFRNGVHDLEKLVQEIQGKGEGQASLSDDNASLFSNDDWRWGWGWGEGGGGGAASVVPRAECRCDRRGMARVTMIIRDHKR
jgi:hypothetical protein